MLMGGLRRILATTDQLVGVAHQEFGDPWGGPVAPAVEEEFTGGPPDKSHRVVQQGEGHLVPPRRQERAGHPQALGSDGGVGVARGRRVRPPPPPPAGTAGPALRRR